MQCVKQSNPHSLERKFFPRFVDGIVRTVKGDPEELLNAANQLYPNLQFSLELSLSCNNPNVNTRENVISGGYQKLIDTGTTLNFRSCALLHYKKNTKESTVNRTFRRISTWDIFEETMEVNRKQWAHNQYSKVFTDKTVPRTFHRLIKRKVNNSPGMDLDQGVLII